MIAASIVDVLQCVSNLQFDVLFEVELYLEENSSLKLQRKDYARTTIDILGLDIYAAIEQNFARLTSRKCVSNVFGLGSVAYWMDATRSCKLCKKRIFPWNDDIMTSEVGATYLKMCGAVLRIRG